MNIFELSATLTCNKHEYDNALDDAEKKASSSGSKIGGFFAGIGKAAAAGLATTGAAVVALTKSSVDAYSDYEQLVGGVKTLFGAQEMSLEEYAQSVGKSTNEVKGEYDKLIEAQTAVLENADNAYKSAGLSANEYMETVTSMAAALNQSLGGDTLAAAEKADQAITDMSDNANKMGTSMEAIQTAYAGFSKQNYTMLDNLKLGYGGTKEEMERLLEDAEKIKASQGEVADYSIDSYADIVDAIHVVQDEMGITGTTAKEASTTIQGSLAMTKSAWDNLVTGLTNPDADISQLINNLVESAKTAAGNLIPAISQALKGIGQLVKGIAPLISQELPSLVSELLPIIIETATELFTGLIDALPDLIGVLIEQLPTVIQSVIDAVVDLLPMLIELGMQMIMTLAQGLLEAIPELIPTITQLITDIALMLTEPSTLVQLVMAAVQIMLALAQGLIQAIPQIIEVLPQIILNIVEALIQLAPQIIVAGVQLIANLIVGIVSMLGALLSAIGELIVGLIGKVKEVGGGLLQSGIELVTNIISGITSMFSNILKAGKDLIDKVINGIKSKYTELKEKGKELVEKVKNGFTEKVEQAKQWGKDLIDNFINGLKEKWENLKSTVSDIAGSIKDYLGFSEPKLGPLSNFHTYAPDMMDLFMQGVEDNKSKLLNTVQGAFDFQDLISSPIVSADIGGIGYNGSTGGGNIYSMLEQILTILPQLANNQIVLDTGVLVGETASQYDEALGQLLFNRQRSV